MASLTHPDRQPPPDDGRGSLNLYGSQTTGPAAYVVQLVQHHARVQNAIGVQKTFKAAH